MSGEKPRVSDDLVKIFAAGGIDMNPMPRDLALDLQDSRREIARLNSLINTPQTREFFEAIKIEMPHQRERWGSDHDAGKTAADWFWLIGYLAGKALHAFIAGNHEKAKHHIITTAAALGNWFLAITGENTKMRPGLKTPTEKESA